MVEQAVDDIGGLAGRRDRDRVVGRLASREVRIEQRGGGAPVMGVDRSDSLARPGGREVLAIRAGHIGGAEQGGERLALLGVDQDRERLAVGFLAQMPGGRPSELPIAGDRAGLGHPGQAEIGGVGQHRGEHDASIIGRRTRMQVREGAAETGPAIHLGEQAGDAKVGHHPIQPVGQGLGLLGCRPP